MMTFAIIALVIGALALLLMAGFVALKIYACVLVRGGKWLDTNRPAWLDRLLDDLV